MRFNKVIATLLLSITTHMMCFAQSEATVVYIEKYRKIAVLEMKRTGIPASITLAQGILESNSGESPLAKKYNNHFGIKCKNDWKGETTFQDDDAKNECFRVYPSAEASFMDHSNFLKNRPNYANLFLLDPLDDSAWAFGLKKSGYATAPDYAKKILKVIDDYELSQYNFPELEDEIEASPIDKESPKNEKGSDTILIKDPPKVDSNTAAQWNKTLKDSIVSKKDTITKILMISDTTTAAINPIKGIEPNDNVKAPSTNPKVNSLPIEEQEVITPITTISKDTTVQQRLLHIPKGVFKINGTSVIWATTGNSYLAIANQYHIPLFKLFEFNDISEADLIEKDQLVFLETKKKTGARSIHTAKQGETLYEISQLEAIQFELLQLYNPSVDKNPLKEGTIIFLFKQKESTPTTIEKTKPIVNPNNTFFKKLFKNK